MNEFVVEPPINELNVPDAPTMKLLLPETLLDSDQLKMFKHEAKVGQSLEHPNFVKFSKVAVNKKRGYLIMDYFRAPNLKTLIQTDLVAVQVRIGKLQRELSRLPSTMRPAEVNDIRRRLDALSAKDSPVPIPKGPMPKGGKIPKSMRG